MESAKIMSATITTVVAVAVADAKEIMDAELADEDATDKADEITKTTIIKKNRVLQL
jgi:hypothetical protein